MSRRKRANGEGTCFQRPNGSWTAQGSYWKDGKLRRISFTAKTKREAMAKLAQAMADIERGTFSEPNKVTVGEWLDTWLTEYKKPSLRPTTWEAYEVIVRCHLKPALGHVLLKDLRPEHLQRLYNQKAADGLSASTVRHIHLVMHGALKQALRNQLVARNAAEAVALPRGEKKQVRAMTPEEEARFLEAVSQDRLGPAFVTLLGTGLRRGELLALRWEDVDLVKGVIQVRAGMIRSKEKGLVFQEPKTATARRAIPLPEDVTAELKRWKARQNQERLALGEAYQDNGLVFATELGTPIEPRNFNRVFYRLREKAGIGKNVNLHALRHSYATRLLERGVRLKVVQELLGHSKYSLTADVYSHVAPELKREAVAVLNGTLRVKKNPAPASGE